MYISQEDKVLNAADKNRVVLYNFDLEINAAKSRLAIEKAKQKRFANSNNEYGNKKYCEAIAEQKKIELYIDELTNAKNETWKGLQGVLDDYGVKYQKIWIYRFIRNMTYQQIADETHYSLKQVNRIVKLFEEDLISYANKEQDNGSK